MSKSTRYLSIKNPSKQNVTQLEEKSFIKLPDAFNPHAQTKFLFIDLKSKNYWTIDLLMLESNSNIVLKNFDETVKPIETESLAQYIN